MHDNVTILALESSCDETAAAVLRGGRLCSNVVATQVARHAAFGGVVPEVASREHMAAVARVTAQALADAETRLDDVGAIAVTTGPGLIGALFVGVMYAKGLALARGLALIGVNHLEGHLAAADLLAERPPFPHIALLASGGHTALYRVDGPFSVRTLGTTRDDAAGEAFDKTAKLLGLGYPGGARLAATGAGGDAHAVALPIGLGKSDTLDFSFSGLKTAVATHLGRFDVTGRVPTGDALRDVCASIEHAIVSALVTKTLIACEREGVSVVVLGGGVGANTTLRARLAESLAERGGRAFIPERALCTDNAAMIAAAGARRFAAGRIAGLGATPRAYWPLSDAFAGA